MKKVLGNVKVITLLVSVVICVVLCNVIATYLFSVHSYSCLFDSKTSYCYQNEIFNFINSTKVFKRASLSSISKKIVNQFRAIKHIELTQLPTSILQVKMEVFDPQFIVNNAYIVSKNGNVFERKFFSQRAIDSCFPVVVTTEKNKNVKTIPETCKQMIFCLPKQSFEQYKIVWESETKSYMVDKKQDDFVIIFNDTHVPDNDILSTCALLKNKLKMSKVFLKKRNTRWVADVRFKDQIVLFSEKRGR